MWGSQKLSTKEAKILVEHFREMERTRQARLKLEKIITNGQKIRSRMGKPRKRRYGQQRKRDILSQYRESASPIAPELDLGIFNNYSSRLC